LATARWGALGDDMADRKSRALKLRIADEDEKLALDAQDTIRRASVAPKTVTLSKNPESSAMSASDPIHFGRCCLHRVRIDFQG
jgi:hypothetical protein